ncbi:MAG: hypothetical protein ACOZNI_27840 [Myxococcota bacterium]
MPLDFVAALPGIVLRESRAAGRYHLLAPDTPAYVDVVSAEPAIGRYLARFSTPFGVPLTPAMVCVTRQARRPDARDLVAFRDCPPSPRSSRRGDRV